MVKITARTGLDNTTEITLDGDLRENERAVLTESIRHARRAGARVVLNLSGVCLADRACMRQLREWMDAGIEIRNAPAYLSQWMRQDRREPGS